MSFLPSRIVIVRPDPETEAIGETAAKLNIPVVKVGQFSAPYAVADYVPTTGDLWVECSPAPATCPACSGRGEDAAGYQSGHCPICGGSGVLDGKGQVMYAGGAWIDHHNPGDVTPGTPAFAASSIGQFIALLGRACDAGKVSAEVLAGLPGLEFIDDPYSYSMSASGLGWHGGPYRWMLAVNPADGMPGKVCFRVADRFVRVGESDHDPVGFAHGRLSTSEVDAVAHLAATARPPVPVDALREAMGILVKLPRIQGFGLDILDARNCPELCPATMIRGADNRSAPQPGTGGRLGSAAFVAAMVTEFPILNWGSQPLSDKGRNIAVIGASNSDGSRRLLESLGAVGIYPFGGTFGGYIPQ
jgi:hypothetical protein